MFVKKFEAPTLEKALSMVKQELGPNALVLSTQQRRRKWYQKPSVEVTAAAEKPADTSSPSFDESELLKVFPHRKRSPQMTDSLAKSEQGDTKRESPRYMDVMGASDGREKREVPKRPQPTPAPRAERYEEEFLRSGFGAGSAKELTRRLIFDYPKEERARPSQLMQIRTQLVASDLRTLSFESLSLHPAWTFVGVGGSGKTSTLVKLALALKAKGQSVQLVAGDRRKIAGRAELASYARLIKAPFAFETKPSGSINSIQLIDTPAIGYEREDHWFALEKLCRDTKPVLVLEATSRIEEMLRMVERVERLGPAAIVFTKLDIVSNYGVLFDAVRSSKIPLLGVSLSPSFKVPFRFFEPIELAQLILKGRN